MCDRSEKKEMKNSIPVKDLIPAILCKLGIPEGALHLDRIELVFWLEVLEESKRLCENDSAKNKGARAALGIIGAVTALEAFVNQRLSNRFRTNELVWKKGRLRLPVPGGRSDDKLEKKIRKLLATVSLPETQRENYEFIRKLIRIRGSIVHYSGLPLYVNVEGNPTGLDLKTNREAKEMIGYLDLGYARKACEEVEKFIHWIENKP